MKRYYVVLNVNDTEKGGQVVMADYFDIDDHILCFYDQGNTEPKFLFHYWQLMFDMDRLKDTVPEKNVETSSNPG